MRIITERDPRAQVAQIRVIVRSGSLSDPQGQAGLANFAARALLRGTTTRSFRELTFAIECLGASVTVGVDQTHTVIRASVLAQNLDPFLDLLKDLLTRPAFDPGEMQTLQKTLLGELRAELQEPQELALLGAIRTVFAGTQAQYSSLGTLDGISRVTPQHLAEFFKKHYRRKNLIIGVVSPLEDLAVEARIQATLVGLSDETTETASLPEIRLSGRKAVVIQREEMSTTPFYLASPGVGDGLENLPTLELGNFVFGEDMTSRLMQVLRAQNGWTYGVSSGYQQLLSPQAQPGFFSISSFPSSQFAGPAVSKTLEMLETYSRSGISDEEFSRARQALSNGYAFKVATAEQRLGWRLRQARTGRVYETMDQYLQRMNQLSLEAVNDAIARQTKVDSLLLVAVGDSEALTPILSSLPGMGAVQVIEPEIFEQS